MLVRSKGSRYVKDNLVGFLALFVALGGTGAYAANTIGSTDIIDGQVKSVDVGNGEINSADVKDESLTTFDVSTFLGADVVDGSLTGDDIAKTSSLGRNEIDEASLLFNNTIVQTDIATGGVASAEVADSSLRTRTSSSFTSTNFQANFGAFAAHECKVVQLGSHDYRGDHLLVTPLNFGNAAPTSIIFTSYRPGSRNPRVERVLAGLQRERYRRELWHPAVQSHRIQRQVADSPSVVVSIGGRRRAPTSHRVTVACPDTHSARL